MNKISQMYRLHIVPETHQFLKRFLHDVHWALCIFVRVRFGSTSLTILFGSGSVRFQSLMSAIPVGWHSAFHKVIDASPDQPTFMQFKPRKYTGIPTLIPRLPRIVDSKLHETPAIIDLCQDLFISQSRRNVDLSPPSAGARKCLNHVSFLTWFNLMHHGHRSVR